MVGESSTQYTSDEVKFGGVLGMLDVVDRVAPVVDTDSGRARWARDVLDEAQRFSKVLGDNAVRGEITAKGTWGQQCSDG